MFDDGRADLYTNAYPALQSAELTATAYVVTDWLGDAGYITAAQAIEMDAAGFDIASHTHTHPHLPLLTQAQQEAEFTAAKGVLDGLGLTRASGHVAYPYCQTNANTFVAMAATGMTTGRRCQLGFESLVNVHDGLGLYQLPVFVYPPDYDADLAAIKTKIDYAKDHNDIIALLFHSIVETPVDDYDFSLSDFVEVLDYINQLELPALTVTDWYQLYDAAY